MSEIEEGILDELMQKIAACDVEIQDFFEALKEENLKLQKRIVELEFKAKIKTLQIYKWPGCDKPWFSLYEATICKSCGSLVPELETIDRKILFETRHITFNGNSCWSTWEEFSEDCFDPKIREQVKVLIGRKVNVEEGS